jgi:hypothetical protein
MHEIFADDSEATDYQLQFTRDLRKSVKEKNVLLKSMFGTRV